jgi:prevent-host-death family protein
MPEIGASEAKNRFDELLDLPEPGEEILITGNGNAVARLVPARQKFDHEAARVAAAEIPEMRKGVRLVESRIKEPIDESRK